MTDDLPPLPIPLVPLKDWLGIKEKSVQLPGQYVWVPEWVMETMTDEEITAWVEAKRKEQAT